MRFSVFNIFTVGLGCLFTAVSCKDSSTDSIDNNTVNGLWKLKSTEGDDCYEIEVSEILGKNGNTYTFEDPFDPQKTMDVEITATNDELTARQLFGDATVTMKYSKFNGNTSSFTPECEVGTVQTQDTPTIF